MRLALNRSMSDRFGFTFKKALLSALRGLSAVMVMNGLAGVANANYVNVD